MGILFLCVALFSLLFPLWTESAAGQDTVTVSGFGSLALTTSDSDTLGFRKNYHSGTAVYKGGAEFRHDSSLGIQANFSPIANVRGVVQLLAKDRLDNSVENVVHYAFLEYSPSFHFSVRGGRIPLDIFLLADYREVGFAYLWARPVSGMYSTLFYDYYDGVEVSYQHHLGRGLAQLKGYVGTLDSTIPLDTVGDLQFSFEPIWGINLQYSSGPWKFIGGFQRGTIQQISEQITVPQNILRGIPDSVFPLSSYLEDQLSLNDSNSDYISGGIAYDDGSWQIQSEISRYRFAKALGLNFKSGYLSVGYSMGSWTPYAVFSRLYSSLDKPDISSASLASYPPEVQAAASSVGALVWDVFANQSTASFGTRWNVCQNMALKFQWDHNWVSGGHSAFWELRDTVEKGDEEVNVYTLVMSFIF